MRTPASNHSGNASGDDRVAAFDEHDDTELAVVLHASRCDSDRPRSRMMRTFPSASHAR